MSSQYTPEQILNVLKEKSDFTFELSTIRMLTRLGHSCSHSGTYVDPVTEKIRQYDIRTEKNIAQIKTSKEIIDVYLRLAVECKCFRTEKPLIVHCTQRQHAESIHDLIYFPNDKAPKELPVSGCYLSEGRVLRFEGIKTEIFPPKEFVGRSISQIHSSRPGNIDLSDGEVFEKLTQSISSVDEIIKDIFKTKRYFNEQIFAVFPVLVIPDGLLWTVNYRKDGEIIDDPRQVEYVSLYLGRDSSPDFHEAYKKFQISHMFLATLSGLEKLALSYFSKPEWDLPPFLGNTGSLSDALKYSK